MTDFTIVIDDKPLLLGITAAREAYNAALPDEFDDSKPPVPIDPKLGTLSDDQAYLQMVVTNAAESYAKQYGMDVVEIDAKISELQVKRAEIIAKG